MCGRPWRTVRPIQAPLASGSRWGSLAGHVKEEEQSLSTHAGQQSLVGQKVVGVDPLGAGQFDFRLPQLVAEPLKAPSRGQDGLPITCHAPGTARDGRAQADPWGRSRARRRVRRRRPRCPSSPTPPGRTMPLPTAPGWLIAPAADDRSPRRQAGRHRPQGADFRRDFRTLVAGRQERHRGRACPEVHGSNAGRRQAATFPRRRSPRWRSCRSEHCRYSPLGQEHLAHPVPVLGFVPADPEELWGREPGQCRVRDHPDQRLAAAGAGEACGKAVKIVAPLLPALPAGVACRVILIERDLNEILNSQAQMLVRRNESLPDTPERRDRLKDAYIRTLQRAKAFLRHRPLTRLLVLQRSEVLGNPAEAALQIGNFLGGDLSTDRMAAEVDPTLHRQRAARD